MSVDTTITITKFRVADDALAAYFTRIEKRLLGQDGIGRAILMRLRDSHTAYCRKLIQYAQLAQVDEAYLPFTGRAAEVVTELQAKHERLLSGIEATIQPALDGEAVAQQEAVWRAEFAGWGDEQALEHIEQALGRRLLLSHDGSAIVSADAPLNPKLQVLLAGHRAGIVELLQARKDVGGYQY